MMMHRRSAVQNTRGLAAATLCIGTPLAAHAAVTHIVTGSAGTGGMLNTASQAVFSGEKAVFLVKANTGYLINTVTGCNGKLSGTTYTTGAITAACTVKATFKTKVVTKYTLTVKTTGSGSGWAGGAGAFPAGATVKLSAGADAGSVFKGWTPDTCKASFTMPAQNLTCTAEFALEQAGDGPEMVSIPAGCFQMGSPESEQGRNVYGGEAQHQVCVDDFEMGKYEVTFEEYDAFADDTGREKPSDEGFGRGKRPVINVDWNDAVAYTEWLSKKTGQNYRLATEAEWEYAARAGTTTAYWWGATASHEYANYGTDGCCDGLVQGRDQWLYTAPVGSFPANPFGLHDTAGNVWEWTCSDWSDPYDGAERKCSTSGSSGYRSIRGSSWNAPPVEMRSATRHGHDTSHRYWSIGFRLARP